MKASSKLLQVRLIVVFDGDATVAIAEGCGIKVAASAKRKPGDRSDPLIGTDLAVSRALRQISRRLERRANGAVRQAAHVKAERAARKAASPGERADVQVRTESLAEEEFVTGPDQNRYYCRCGTGVRAAYADHAARCPIRELARKQGSKI